MMWNTAAPLCQAPLITPVCLSRGRTRSALRPSPAPSAFCQLLFWENPDGPLAPGSPPRPPDSCHSPLSLSSRSPSLRLTPLQPSIMPVSALSPDPPTSKPRNNPFPTQSSPLRHLCRFMPRILKSLASRLHFQPRDTQPSSLPSVSPGPWVLNVGHGVAHLLSTQPLKTPQVCTSPPAPESLSEHLRAEIPALTQAHGSREERRQRATAPWLWSQTL